jgi:peptidyl-prolyl cis-trans isomerase A (cyclophilin A)
LDNKHTVFWSRSRRTRDVDSVEQGDVLESIEIIRVGEEAANWNAMRLYHFQRAKQT